MISLPTSPRGRAVLAAGTLAAAAVLGGVAYAAAAPLRSPPASVPVARRDLVEAVEVSGVAESGRRIVLKARAGGAVQALPAAEGRQVASGLPLLVLDGEQARLALQQALGARDAAVRQAGAQRLAARRTLAEAEARQGVALAALADRLAKARAAAGQLERDLVRVRALAAEGGVSRQALEQQEQQGQQARLDVRLAADELARARSASELVAARNALAVADAALASATTQGRDAVALARKALADTALPAPFTGVVTDWKVEVGDLVAPGAPVGTFQDLAALRVQLPVDELDLPKMRVGGPVELVFDAYPEAPVAGRIAQVSRASVEGAANVRVYPVEVRFANPGGRVVPGMSCDARVVVRRLPRVLAVPAAAVAQDGGRATVRVLGAGNRVETRAIEPGLATVDAVEVRAGLAEGERVLAGPGATP